MFFMKKLFDKSSPDKNGRFKKRHLLYGYIAFEIAGLAIVGTAGAQVLDQIKFEVPQSVVSATVPTDPGLTRLIVTSNAPFTISTAEAIGEFNVKVLAQGLLNTTPFGMNAQMPGPETACASALSPHPAIIYRATQKTAASRGPVLSQAVMVEIRYDSAASPKFAVKTQDNSTAINLAASCENQMG